MEIVFIVLLTVVSVALAVIIFLGKKRFALELAQLSASHQALQNRLQRNILFAKQIASGEYSFSDTTLEEDDLGRSLSDMSLSLKNAAHEEDKRRWAMTGLTRLAEIIRLSNNDLETLSNNIITFLVKYLDANQGSLFVLVDEDDKNQYLDLKACYAFDRKKFLHKQLHLGEGLLGQAVLEKDTIFLTEIPSNYISITSGLGQASPKCIIIIPLKTEDGVVGAMEIASFKVFEKHECDFLEKASESIASSILTSRINENTHKLLQEAQDLTFQLRQQEEETRQNMEELEATQEEMVRKEKEIVRLLEESQAKERMLEASIQENARLERDKEQKTLEMIKQIENQKLITTMMMNNLPQKIFLKDSKGRFMLLNEPVAKDLNSTIEDLIGKNDFDLFSEEDASKFWKTEKEEVLDKGNRITNYEDFEIEGVRKYFYTIKMPFRFPGTDEVGILGYQSDITEIKNLENTIKMNEKIQAQQLSELRSQLENKNN